MGVDRARLVLAWAFAAVALVLSLSGWFALFGLVLSPAAFFLGREAGSRRVMFIAVGAAALAVAWFVVSVFAG